MDATQIFDAPDEKIWSVIRAKYNEDPDVVGSLIREFRNWLKIEPDLPKNADESIIRNLIRHQECNLEAAKQKFKRYIACMKVIKANILSREFGENYFKKMIHRFLTISKNLTPEGYRLVLLKLPSNIEEFEFDELIHYIIILAELILHCGSCSGYIGIYDLQNVPVNQLDRVNLNVFTQCFEMICNVEPHRIISLYLLNVPDVPEDVKKLFKSMLKPEFICRVLILEDSTALKKYLSEDVIPSEYGGTLNYAELTENMKTFLLLNKNWVNKVTDVDYYAPRSK